MTESTAKCRRWLRVGPAVALCGTLLVPGALAGSATAETTPPVDAPETWQDGPTGFASTQGGTTGGAGGKTVTVNSYDKLVEYASAQEPYVIRVEGAIKVNPFGEEVEVASNKTIVGVGAEAQIVNGGFFLDGSSNVIIRNLTIRDTRKPEDDPDDDEWDYDAIQMDGADHVWIDHNRLERMNDGIIDSREDTTNVTVSWNVINENHKTFGIGWTENLTARLTIHHNWFSETEARNPNIDHVAMAHLYNNYLQNTGSGHTAEGGTTAVVENSYFEGVVDPLALESEDSSIVERGNVFVDCEGSQDTGGTGFDPGQHYEYTLDPAKEVPALVEEGAGPQANIGA